jgi:hypothetical protein
MGAADVGVGAADVEVDRPDPLCRRDDLGRRSMVFGLVEVGKRF